MKIIGGGPVGLWAAKSSADRGLDVQVFEKNASVGVPEHCTGLLSRNIRDIVEPDLVLHYIHGARFYAGDERAVLEKEKAALVIDRVEFDIQLMEEAQASGARVETGRPADWRNFSGDVVAADGVTGRTRIDLGQNLEFLPALQFDLKERPSDDFVELWFEPESEFFTWVVPRGNRVRVGTASQNLRGLRSFVRRRFGRIRIDEQYSGLVVTSGPVEKTEFRGKDRNLFLVGDAAGQVKPTTGGGIVTGLTCAEILADSLAEGRSYEDAWRKELGRELSLQRIARWVMARNPEGFVRFIRENRGVLEAAGDMDRQMTLLGRLFWPASSLLLGTLWPF